MVISIGGKYWLWRAVDNEGEVLDFLVQRRRDVQAAKKLIVKLLKKHGFAPTLVGYRWFASIPHSAIDHRPTFAKIYLDLAGLTASHAIITLTTLIRNAAAADKWRVS